MELMILHKLDVNLCNFRKVEKINKDFIVLAYSSHQMSQLLSPPPSSNIFRLSYINCDDLNSRGYLRNTIIIDLHGDFHYLQNFQNLRKQRKIVCNLQQKTKIKDKKIRRKQKKRQKKNQNRKPKNKRKRKRKNDRKQRQKTKTKKTN